MVSRRCKTNDAVVYDYVTKKISCSDCGLEFGLLTSDLETSRNPSSHPISVANTEPNNASSSSSDGDILKNLGFDPLAVATTQKSNAPSDDATIIASMSASGRSPSSVAASVVYIIAQLSHEKRVLLKGRNFNFQLTYKQFTSKIWLPLLLNLTCCVHLMSCRYKRRHWSSRKYDKANIQGLVPISVKDSTHVDVVCQRK
uniref:TFIIB-type domain-containing protein n=1 Tax=Brassica campestris TaxID=3711 RepID=M4DDR1_BRACM